MRRLATLDEADVPIRRTLPDYGDPEKPSRFKKFPIGTWAKGMDGERYQLRKIRIDDPDVVFPEGTGRTANAEKYAEWIRQGSPVPPMQAVESPGGKIVVTDGHQRAYAMKLAGVKDAEAWVAPVKYWETVTGTDDDKEDAWDDGWRKLVGIDEP